MDFSTETMTILRRGGDPWSKTAPTGADAACVQARSPARWARNSPPDAPLRLEDALNEPFDFAGNDIGDGAVLAGETIPEPSDYLSEIQRDGKPLGADLVYWEAWQWLDQRGCSQFVAPRLIEAYAQAFAGMCSASRRSPSSAYSANTPPPVPPSPARLSPCPRVSGSRRMCIGTRFTRSCAPPAPPITRAPRPATR